MSANGSLKDFSLKELGSNSGLDSIHTIEGYPKKDPTFVR